MDFGDLEQQFKVERKIHSNVVVIDNAPKVDEKKREKFIGVIKKLFKNIGDVLEVYMEEGSDGKSKGFLFVAFETEKQALLAIEHVNGYQMDKNHQLIVSRFVDIPKMNEYDGQFVEPKINPYEEPEPLKEWLLDSFARDQFAILSNNQLSVHWNDKNDFEVVQSRTSWCDYYFSWSPRGSYIVTVHKQGIALWGGKSWKKIVRIVHPNVKLFDFSPNETFIITWSPEPFSAQTQKHNIAIWSVATGALLRSMSAEPEKSQQGKLNWPYFKWSHDESLFSKMVPGKQGSIGVYDSATMGLCDKKSLKIENLVDYSWSCSQNLICYWIPEVGNIPARVTMMKMPTREIVRTKNLFNVSDCKFYWHNTGAFCLVRIDRTKGSKKAVSTSFELYRMKEKDIPVDVFECNSKDDILQIYWEPYGKRFATLVAEGSKSLVQIYKVDEANIKASSISLIKEIDARGITSLHWSPKGRYLVGAALSGSGTLNFWDTDDVTSLGSGEHYSCTDLEWDPTGRYIITSVSGWKIPNDTGFQLWSLSGEKIMTKSIPGFKQLNWRPRPPTLLSEEQVANIQNSLGDYSKEFNEQDQLLLSMANKEVYEKRMAQLKEYKSFMSRFDQLIADNHDKIVAIFGFNPYENQ